MVTKTTKKKVRKKSTVKTIAEKVLTKKIPSNNSKWSPSLKPVILNLASHGKTNIEIAMLLGICEATYYNWINNYCPELLKPLEKTKEEKIKQVEKSLFERANGYYAKETKTHMTKSGIIKTKEIIKHYPPSETAIKYYLGNKDNKNWKDQTQVNLGNGETGEAFDFPFTLDKAASHRAKEDGENKEGGE